MGVCRDVAELSETFRFFPFRSTLLRSVAWTCVVASLRSANHGTPLKTGNPRPAKDLRISGRLRTVPFRSETFRFVPFRSVSFRFVAVRCVDLRGSNVVAPLRSADHGT